MQSGAANERREEEEEGWEKFIRGGGGGDIVNAFGIFHNPISSILYPNMLHTTIFFFCFSSAILGYVFILFYCL